MLRLRNMMKDASREDDIGARFRQGHRARFVQADEPRKARISAFGDVEALARYIGADQLGIRKFATQMRQRAANSTAEIEKRQGTARYPRRRQMAAHIGGLVGCEKGRAFTARRQHARVKLLILLREAIKFLFEHAKLSPRLLQARHCGKDQVRVRLPRKGPTEQQANVRRMKARHRHSASRRALLSRRDHGAPLVLSLATVGLNILTGYTGFCRSAPALQGRRLRLPPASSRRSPTRPCRAGLSAEPARAGLRDRSDLAAR
jgi:hypothetical protein